MAPFRLLALLVAGCSPAVAAPELAPLFQDHGVLQCEKPVPVWGRAEPGEHLSVVFAGQKVGAAAGPDGRWIAVLAPLVASAQGADLTVSGKTTTTVHDLLVGEVWLCAGGAGMEAGAGGGTPEVGYPPVRHFTLARQGADAPMETAGGGWEACSQETAARSHAVGYFFARSLFERLGVPVGVIDCTSAGSSLDAWMSPAGFAALPAVRNQPGGVAQAPEKSAAPSALFNGMIHPLLPYAVRGVLWWQGEGDLGRTADYAQRFPALITAWRSHFGEGDLPFFWVQLAGPRSASGSPDDRWARLREAQSRALALPATGQVVAIDAGEAGSREVARRLALIALATVYLVPLDYSGPVYSGSAVEGPAIRVRFNFASEGLTASGKPLQSFEVAGADRVFHAAVATIKGDSVLVRSAAVSQPVAVRYAWRNASEANLYNGAGLPAPPFRSDDW
jgi:sialate O-acetylesterase